MPIRNYTLFICLAVLFSIPAYAQHTDLVDSSQSQVLADTASKYAIPDMKRKKKNWTEFHTKWFTGQMGFAPILDYNHFIQDEDSKAQVGEQENRVDLRSGRFSVRGKLLFKRPWSYLISMEYKGMDRSPEDDPFGFTDVKFVIPVFRQWNLTVGKIKETFVYEMVGDAANLPHQERILSPFFVSRNYGFTMGRTFLNDRITLTGGWFNDWFIKGQSFAESANTFTFRLTGLPRYASNGKEFLHMGIGYRYLEAENGVLRLKGRNESNVSSNYVDTKDFAASNSHNISIEQLWSLQNFSVLGEVAHTWAITPGGTEQFSGLYLTTSYIISGDQRPYDKKAAYARRVIPESRFGALEVYARVSKLNLNSSNITGGVLDKYTFGINWWATQHWKTGLAYGIANLDKDDVIGITNSFQFRIQWIY